MKEKTPQCDMREALVSLLYDEAAPKEAARMQKHLAECNECTRELGEFERVRSLLRRWELDDVPVLRIAPQLPRRRALEVFKELLTVMPIWVKSLGVAVAAVLVLAVVGAEVRLGPSGFSFTASLFSGRVPAPRPSGAPDHSDAQIRAVVNDMIVASARDHKNELHAELQRIETALQEAHASDLARLTARIKDYRARLDTLERDIDRREGLDLADLLLSGTLERNDSPAGGGAGQ